MNCPNCGKEALPGALFCTGCGGRLDIAAKGEGLTSMEAETDVSEDAVNNEAVRDAEFVISDTANNEAAVENSSGEAAGNETSVNMPAADNTNGLLGGTDFKKPSETVWNGDTVNMGNNSTEKRPSLSYPVKPLSTWSFVWREFVCAIPIINLIVLFVLAFAEGINKNSRSFARARLLYMLIGAIIIVALGVMVYIFSDSLADWFRATFIDLYEAIK